MRLIDADALIFTHEIARSLDDGHNWNELCITADEIAEAPTIEPKGVQKFLCEQAYREGQLSKMPKRGEWIDNTSETWTPSKKCSECGLVVHSVATDSTDFHAKLKMNFCPQCGADMRKESE